ncbi:MAG: fumarylacetoacetate hydrolase family protein [Candidatus Saccharibacteria bacterium]
MRIARILVHGMPRMGVIQGDFINLFKGTDNELPGPEVGFGEARYYWKECELLPPVTPGKIVCVGLNYRDHAAELNMNVPEEPVLFIKPASSLVGTHAHIIYPKASQQLDYEAELAVVIGRTAKSIKSADALKYVYGYTCGNDVTARDFQRKDGQWTRAKSFDTFCPLGPWIETELDSANLKIKSWLNGQVRQDSSTSQLIFPVDQLIEFISGIMTLDPGDVIMTGTPPGVGPMQAGDEISVEIEGIGSLTNTVVAESVRI